MGANYSHQSLKNGISNNSVRSDHEYNVNNINEIIPNTLSTTHINFACTMMMAQ